jgi:DNA-binding transcriptional ArsR family regulator
VDTQLVRALLNPMRIRIFDALAEGPASPEELAATLKENPAVVSYHVGVMRTTGCIQPAGPTQAKRRIERTYELSPLASAARRRISRGQSASPTLGHPSAGVLRMLVEKEMAALDGIAGERTGDRVGCLSLALDQRGLRQVSAAIAAALAEVSIAEEESAKRLAGTGEKAIEATIAVASFKSTPSRAASL